MIASKGPERSGHSKHSTGNNPERASRAAILDAAEALIVEEGYAAVSNRRVAARAELKPALVQYHFPVMDALFLAVYRRAAELSLERQAEALAQPRPLAALWNLLSDPSRNALAIEFIALANHRKSIRAEIAAFADRSFAMQCASMERALANRHDGTDPAGAAVLLSAVARALVMEQSLGISHGHSQARQIVENWLERDSAGAMGDD